MDEAMSATTTVGIIGLGPMGLRHAQAAVAAPTLQLLGGTDRRTEQAEALGHRAPGARFFPDAEALLEHPPEVLVIATNGPSHYALFEQGRAAGVRRFVIEKPLATSMSTAKAMAEAAEADGLRVVINLSRRYSPLYLRLQKRLHVEGVIGAPVSFHGVLGASGLGCNGSHVLDLGCMLLDARPVEVAGRVEDLGLPNPRGAAFADPGGYGYVRLEQGRRLLLDMGDDFGVQGKYQLLGRYGRLVIDEIRRSLQLEARDAAGREQALSRVGAPLHDRGESYDPPIDVVDLAGRAMLDAAGEGPVVCGIQEATDSLAMVVGLHLSSEDGGRPVPITAVAELAGDREYNFT